MLHKPSPAQSLSLMPIRCELSPELYFAKGFFSLNQLWTTVENRHFHLVSTNAILQDSLKDEQMVTPSISFGP